MSDKLRRWWLLVAAALCAPAAAASQPNSVATAIPQPNEIVFAPEEARARIQASTELTAEQNQHWLGVKDEAQDFARQARAMPVDNEIRDIDALRVIVHFSDGDDRNMPLDGWSQSDRAQLAAIAKAEDAIAREQREREARDRCRNEILGRAPEQVDVTGITADWKRMEDESDARWQGDLEHLQRSLSPAGQAKLGELIDKKKTDRSLAVSRIDAQALARINPTFYAKVLQDGCEHQNDTLPRGGAIGIP